MPCSSPLRRGPIGCIGRQAEGDEHAPADRRVEVPHVSSDPAVKLDYDIVYVRAPRNGDDVGTNWAEVASPLFLDAGADLLLLHPDGKGGSAGRRGKGFGRRPHGLVRRRVGLLLAVPRPRRLDGHRAAPAGADIYKIHVKTRQIVRLTHQQFTPNTGAGDWSKDFRTPEPGKNSIEYGVFNTGPCPLPGGKVVFTSNRNGFRPPKRLPHIPCNCSSWTMTARMSSASGT